MAQKIVDRRKRNAPAPLVEWIGGELTALDGTVAAAWLHRGRPVAQRPLEGAAAGVALAGALRALDATKRPARVRVDASSAELLLAADVGVEVVAGETPEVARLQAVIDDDARVPDEEETSLTHGGRVTPGVLAGFFEAAGRFQLASPWRHLSETDLLQVRCPALGLGEVVASVFNLPSPGDGTRGIACFANADEFKAFRKEVDDVGEDASEHLPSFVLNLLTPRTLSPEVMREVSLHGLPVVDGRVPYVVGSDATPVSPRRVLQAWAVLEAVNWAVGREADGKTLRFDALLSREASVTFLAAMIPGLPRVEVTPLPSQQVDFDEVEPTPEEQHAETVWLWGEAYFEEQLAMGRSKRSLRPFNVMVDVLCTALETLGRGPLPGWSADELETAWLGTVSEEVQVSATELTPGLDEVATWLRWCEATDRLAEGGALAELVVAARARFGEMIAAGARPGERRSLDAYYDDHFGDDEE